MDDIAGIVAATHTVASLRATGSDATGTLPGSLHTDKELSVYKSIRVGAARSPLVVVGVTADTNALPRSISALDKRSGSRLAEARSQPGFKGEPGECVAAGDHHMLVGLGKAAELTAEMMRTVGARLVRMLDRRAARGVKLMIIDALPARGLDADVAGRCLGEGMGLANWRVEAFAGSASKFKKSSASLSVDSDNARFRRGLASGLVRAASVNEARRIAATPPNICTPAWIASEARRLGRAHRLKARVINHKTAARLGMGGIVSVGRGSASKPCLVILEHKPPRAARGVCLALVGKTITYDTGGYSLKVNNGMKGMKYDKCGGAAVLGAMHAIARLKLPVHVVALLPAAENMVSDDSYRPDDIIRMFNGVSVEVTNTDAEGRLVLADALAYACRQFKPTVIVDAATLTGGIVTALGHFCAGVFCNDDTLLSRVMTAAESSGDALWRMPLWKEHREFMRAQHADLLNSNPSRNAHPIQGAAFLSFFVDDNIPWAHIDIAGVAAVESDKDLYAQGPTGYGVRLLTDLAAGLANRQP
jgi:leucyl aminopeptidase